ncbi:hypothetical protein ANN_20289 [Periplaneta americana]|uniref:DUF4812 domain-containing protein n=1 Tax=Periplaneta americana TaxID=6978 RepID=A0ABQ8SCL6_PERAM|nr:hypothetical protein ANN_20289 [Periplaneta americana]
MRLKIRYRLPDIRLTVGKTCERTQPDNQPKRESLLWVGRQTRYRLNYAATELAQPPLSRLSAWQRRSSHAPLTAPGAQPHGDKDKNGPLHPPLANAYSNFQIAKQLHRENLEHKPLPDTVEDKLYRAMQAKQGQPRVSAVGYRGYGASGPSQCSKLRVYRPKTATQEERRLVEEVLPPRPSTGRVSDMQLAICWDLKPPREEDEPKPSPHIDGSNGSAAPAVFALVHQPAPEHSSKGDDNNKEGCGAPPGKKGDDTPPGKNNHGTPPGKNGYSSPPTENSGTPLGKNGRGTAPENKGSGTPPEKNGCGTPLGKNGCGTPLGKNGCGTSPGNKGCNTSVENNGCGTPQGKNGCGTAPGISDYDAPPGNTNSIFTVLPRTAWGEGKENSSPNVGISHKRSGSAEGGPRHFATLERRKVHQSSPNLASHKQIRRPCVACDTRDPKYAHHQHRPHSDYKMAFKAGKPNNSFDSGSTRPHTAKPVRVPKPRPPFAKRSYSIDTLTPPFSLWPGHTAQGYPEHWRLASVYQHAYKPIEARRKPLLASVYQ